jgi:hypothetical protein
MRTRVFVAAFTMLALSACTAITDFDMPAGGLYDLNANIAPGAVSVTLAGDGTGSLVLNLTEPLPETDPAQQAAMDAEMLALLTDGTINVTVQNTDNSVSVPLNGNGTQGSPPDGPGEYALSLDATRAVLTIQFYNATADGSMLQADQSYNATIDVLDNDYFVATAGTPITRAVTVN